MNLPAAVRSQIERLMVLAGDTSATAGEKLNALDMATSILAAHGATWADVISLIPVRPERREHLWEAGDRMDREDIDRMAGMTNPYPRWWR